MKNRLIVGLLLLAVAAFVGCAGSGRSGLVGNKKNFGGVATVTSTNGVNVGTVQQGDNPNSATKQSLNQDRHVKIKAPAGSLVRVDGIEVTSPTNREPVAATIQTNGTNVASIKPAAPLTAQPGIEVSIDNTTHNDTALGSSFEFTLPKAMQIIWPCLVAGLAFIVLGAAQMIYPALRIGTSTITPVVSFSVGGGLIAISYFLPAYGGWILIGGVVAFGIYAAVHWGHLQLSDLKSASAVKSKLEQDLAEVAWTATPARPVTKPGDGKVI